MLLTTYPFPIDTLFPFLLNPIILTILFQNTKHRAFKHTRNKSCRETPLTMSESVGASAPNIVIRLRPIASIIDVSPPHRSVAWLGQGIVRLIILCYSRLHPSIAIAAGGMW